MRISWSSRRERPGIGNSQIAGCLYYPQGLAENDRHRIVSFNKRKQIVGYQPRRQKPHLREYTGYPSSILEFPVDELGLHPVAKPVELLNFLIETYTMPGAVVL